MVLEQIVPKCFVFRVLFLLLLFRNPIPSLAFSCGTLFSSEYQVPFTELQPGMYFVRGFGRKPETEQFGVGFVYGIFRGTQIRETEYVSFDRLIVVGEEIPDFPKVEKKGSMEPWVLPIGFFSEGPLVTVFSGFNSMMRHFLKLVRPGDHLVFKTKAPMSEDHPGTSTRTFRDSWVIGKYRSHNFEEVEVVDLTGEARRVRLLEIQPDSLGFQYEGAISHRWFYLNFLEEQFHGRTIRLTPKNSAEKGRSPEEIEGVLLRKDPRYEDQFYLKELEVSVFILTRGGVRVVLLEDLDHYAIEFLSRSDSDSFRGSVGGSRVRLALKDRGDSHRRKLTTVIEGVRIDSDGARGVGGRHQDRTFILTEDGIHVVPGEDLSRYDIESLSD